MIDLSFLTEEEQEAIMKVLQRDAELKRTEEERVRHLPEKVKDRVQLKNMSGQWFYEAKSKRHRDKIHGADIIRASMRRKPATIAEMGQNKMSKAKISWVNNVNKEVFMPPDLHSIVEHQEEQQKTSSSSKEVTPALNKPEERPMKAVSSVRQRRNPFNSTASDDNLNSEESEDRPATVPQLSKKEIWSLSEDSPPKSNLQNDERDKPEKPSVELTDESQKELAKRPVPKARKLIHKAADSVSQREDLVPKPAKQTERINGIGTPPRGILKRSSSSSSTDSEVRVSQMLDVQKKNGLSTATIFEGEGEKNSLTEGAEDSTQNSLEKLKQVRFSSSSGEGKPLQNPQLHNGKEKGEHDILKPDQKKNSGNYAVQSDSLGDKQISAAKPLGTCSSTSQMKTVDDIEEDTSASSPFDSNRSIFPVSESFQTNTVTPNKLGTPKQTSSNILSNSNYEQSVDQTHEKKSNQILSHESESHKNFTDEYQLSAEAEALEVSNTNSTSLQQGSEEELNPVLMALKRSADRKKPSKSLEDIPSATSISTVTSQPDKLFSNPEKLKGLSKSVPSFLQEEVSGSLMSIYSADFGSVDVKGNIQFAIDYVEKLNELHIFICQCKDLAVADVKRQRSDPYVKTYLLPEKYRLGKRKTSVKKKTFNPVYNEILRYKIEKELLTNQSLNISVWHNDTFGRNSFLGEVELDLGAWDWNDPSNKQINWFPLKPRTSAVTLNLENRGEMKLALQYVPHPIGGKKTLSTGEVHIWVKECHNLPLLRGNRLNSFIKCTILPDTSRKSRQKTRTVAKTTNPVFNHTMVYDGFRPEDLKEACIELTVWDHNKLANHFLGGLRIGLGTGKSYGTTVDWMDSTSDETALWEKMMNSPNTWVEDTLPLRMLMVAKLTK
ncbi:synaptotagmin-like protein 2 isoform X14 [Oenanthe melanoleuca]|uniref:synaptotagmin-like protein 2 isoform X14 n=1 Tax=Oenanthe melanoleuca TaxID=2939378 RepID=UPI0024C15D2B|nr:synaptotagmin-like protein 2 isoform X14 [Oenanthe melanoleuca]